MLDYLRHLFDASDFPTRWHCGAWTPGMGWASQAADAVIALAYFAIPAALLWIWWLRRRDFGRRGSSILLWFVAFISLCGVTHACNVLAFHWPAYRLFVAIKVATGVVSACAAAIMPRVIREAVKMPTRDERHQLVGELQVKCSELELLNAQLADHIQRLESRRDAGTPYKTIDVEIAELRRLLQEVAP